MLPRSVHAPSVIVGVLGVLVVGLSMSQLAPHSLSWGPPKKSIVNIFARVGNGLPSGGWAIPPGGSYTVYQVPSDRWLTVTGTAAQCGGTWAEEFGGVRTEKGWCLPQATPSPLVDASPAGCGGEIGWTFRPGAQVIITHAGGGGNTTLYAYSLIGYETRE